MVESLLEEWSACVRVGGGGGCLQNFLSTHSVLSLLSLAFLTFTILVLASPELPVLPNSCPGDEDNELLLNTGVVPCSFA